VWHHFVFLFLIVLPISTGLLGRSGTTPAVVMIYGMHALIASLNLLLWINVHRSVAAHAQIVRSSLALTLFLMALAIGATQPYIAPYLWFAVFAISLHSLAATSRTDCMGRDVKIVGFNGLPRAERHSQPMTVPSSASAGISCVDLYRQRCKRWRTISCAII
jgi:hypothetical protein